MGTFHLVTGQYRAINKYWLKKNSWVQSKVPLEFYYSYVPINFRNDGTSVEFNVF